MLKIIRRVMSFADWSRSHPSQPHPGDMLDAQFDEIIDQVDRQDAKVEEFLRNYAATGASLMEQIRVAIAEAVTEEREALRDARVEINHLKNQLSGVLQAAQSAAARAELAANPPEIILEAPFYHPPTAALAPPAPAVAATDPNVENDALAADANAMLWADVSHAWAEHMPDTIPPNILAEMAISGEHWSARWWANQAAGAFGMLTSLYLGVHEVPPTSNNAGGPIEVGSIYYNSITQQPYVWTGSGWAPFLTASKTSDVMLFYRAAAGQLAFPLTTLDIDGQSAALNPDAPQDVEVHKNGSLLVLEAGSGFGHYTVDIGSSTITMKTACALNDMIAVNVLVSADNLRPGGVLVYAIKDIDLDPVTSLPGRQDGVRKSFDVVVQSGDKTVNAIKTEEMTVSVDGVIQEPGIAYQASGNTITFDVAPAADSVVFAIWSVQGGGSGGGGGVEEAPFDGTPYWRMSGEWAPASAGGAGTMPEAPTDGKIYGRKSAGWQNVFLDGVKIPTGKTLAFDQTGGTIIINEAGGGSYPALSLGITGYVESDRFSVVAHAATTTKFGLSDSSGADRALFEMNMATQVLTLGLWESSGIVPVGQPLILKADGVFLGSSKLLSDAASDGKQYARQNGAWAEVVGAVPEAPADGKLYARKDGAWVEIAVPSGIWAIDGTSGNAVLTISGTKVASVTPAGYFKAKDEVEAFSTSVG